MKILQKIRREFIVGFSKLCLKSARNDYLGLDLRYPMIYGIGRGYTIPKEIWMGQCLRAFVETKDGCVIDVGVNVGVYLVKLKAITDDVEYYGFEPNHVCNFYTQELIRMNSFKSVKILPFALSNKYGLTTLYASKLGDKGGSLVYETKNMADTSYSFYVYTVRGDDFIKELNIDEISVIKVDVEGAEFEVLEGLDDTINKYRPYFYIEIWGDYQAGTGDDAKKRITNIYNYITAHNYTILAVLGEERNLTKMNSTSDIIANNFDCNYIFVPNELVDVYVKKVLSMEECDVSSDMEF